MLPSIANKPLFKKQNNRDHARGLYCAKYYGGVGGWPLLTKNNNKVQDKNEKEGEGNEKIASKPR
mgnify:CR=1 FL=1